MLARFPFSELIHWYTEQGRTHLPWRHFEWLDQRDIAYRVWLSEILLQQTQAERVAGFFERIIQRFPHIESLAETDYETFFPYYDGLGYYSRARNLLKTAKIVTETYGGIFPRETQQLIKLPGIGPYTAEAIRAFAYNIPTLSFDTNLEKVFSRYYFGDRFRKLSKEEKMGILADFQKTGISGRAINAAFMDFASLVSVNHKEKIDFSKYPLPGCLFFERKGTLEAEKRTKSEVFPTKDAVITVILADHKGEIHYRPFFLPPNPDMDHRAVIKWYFEETFNIIVSVRPAFKKAMIQDIPHAFYRTRIQTGVPDISWEICSKNDISNWLLHFTEGDEPVTSGNESSKTRTIIK